MYKIKKRMEICAAHKLDLPYESKCKNLHGHGYIVTVYCESETVNEQGMVVDFALMKQRIHGLMDHGYLNDIFDFNPTAENMARWICDEVTKMCETPTGRCYRVDVQESEGNIATYEVHP